MRYAGIIKNDFSAATGVCTTFFTQGCPHQCPGCHNPETWDFLGGKEFTPDVLQDIEEAITANGVERSFCIMGGEPMCRENQFLTDLVISQVREKFPTIKIYLWTGYLLESIPDGPRKASILSKVDCIIDGPYDRELRDSTLLMRGSSNQRILYKGTDF